MCRSRSMSVNNCSTGQPVQLNSEREKALWRDGSGRKFDASPSTANHRQRICERSIDHTAFRSNTRKFRSPRTMTQRRSHFALNFDGPGLQPACVKRCNEIGKEILSSCTISSDNEYNELYNKCGGPSNPSHVESNANSRINDAAGDSIAPREFLHIYMQGSRKDRSQRSLQCNADNWKSTSCRETLKSVKSSSLSSANDTPHRDDQVEGKWVQTVCFGSVWYSKSEVHEINRRRTINSSVRTSRIPRLCCPPRNRAYYK